LEPDVPVVYLPAPPGRNGTFPDGPLGLDVELLLGNTWTSIKGFVKMPLTITRGRADGQQQVGPSTLPMVWNNYDGRFSPRNPVGPYYGKLGRNTPVRASIPADHTHLRLASNDGSSCSTPSSSGLSASGDLDIRIDLDLHDSRQANLMSKWNDTITGDSWALTLESDGSALFTWYTGTKNHVANTGIETPLGRGALRVTLALSTGLVTFYTAPSISGSWTQLGNTTTVGATSVLSTSTPVAIGAGFVTHGTAQGRVYAASIAIGGATKASPDFTSAVAGGATVTDAQGNVWSLAGTAEYSDRDYRFSGECAALPQQWDRDDVWTPVSAAGPLRRASQNNAPLDSALKRGYVRLGGNIAPVAYWPCEDGVNAQSIAPAIGGVIMRVNDPPSFAANSDFLCSAPIPTMNGSSWYASIPKYSGGTDAVLRFLMEIPSGGEADGSIIAIMNTSGTVRQYVLYYHTGGALQAIGFDKNGTHVFDTGPIAFGVNGKMLRVSLELRQSGSNINYSFVTIQVGASSGSGFAGTLTSATLGHATKIVMNSTGLLTSTAMGHISFQSTWDSLFDLSKPLNAWQGETAANRFSRLCAEENIPCQIYGAPDNSAMMGAQSVDTLVNLLQECESADLGMMFEPLDIVGLGYRTYGSLCSQSPTATLDYSLDHLAPPLTPTDDDQYTQNDITVSRPTGSSARAFLNDASPMSISPPPIGVGSYAASATANVSTDTELADVANWLLHLGTVDEERYPSIVVDLTYRAMASMFYQVLGTRLGDMTSIINVPYFLPPDGVKAIVWGQTENLADFVCNTTWQTQPESPHEVLIAGSGAVSDCRADTSGSVLGTGINATSTSIQVIPASTGNALWTTASGDMPFDIIVGGERMTVTNVSGSSSPQTFTVTRSVNGVVKTHSADENVALFSPVYVALS
jgi:hypothetical protein